MGVRSLDCDAIFVRGGRYDGGSLCFVLLYVLRERVFLSGVPYSWLLMIILKIVLDGILSVR